MKTSSGSYICMPMGKYNFTSGSFLRMPGSTDKAFCKLLVQVTLAFGSLQLVDATFSVYDRFELYIYYYPYIIYIIA